MKEEIKERRKQDKEVKSILQIMNILESLSEDGKKRAMEYVASRMTERNDNSDSCGETEVAAA